MRSNNARPITVVLLVMAVATAASGCTGGPSRGTTASHLIMGGPPECRTRITCLPGLEQIYGLHFKAFKSLDEVGPVSVAALAANVVQVVRLDSSDPAIPRHKWVILQDDKSFQPVGNIIPVIRSSKATPKVVQLLNTISSAMTQGDLFMLDIAVGTDHQAPQDAARNYVQRKGLGVAPGTEAKESLTVGSAAFSENEVLADVYIEVLRSAGYAVNESLNIGSREKYEPELETGQIDILPEYVGNYLTFLNGTLLNVALSSAVTRLRALLAPKELTVLDPSSATDSDTVVVTEATAARFHLTKISDLGTPSPG